MTSLSSQTPAGQRGPSDHVIRDQIILAAQQHFSHYGYGKTTVSDLARNIGYSKAYIYKFFDSKQAIGEAICARSLAGILAEVEAAAADGKSATEKLRRMVEKLTSLSAEFFFADRKLYDIAVHSAIAKWPPSQEYIARIKDILAGIIVEGREANEFECKTPLDETCRAIVRALQPFVSPLMLQYNLDDVPRCTNETLSLILRSLAP
ncbi:AcrR family transcriptional regulator (plasmid) [Sphingomonas panacis]|uniref:AcrR family transcriptional regulator n=1 Tax=Sphingomonas panacis TaxID=1560345 RepID=A0A1B3ZIQ6_9SPHN|nr:TetR/AcrR family transcriptional regulator [Sphingomonas panacis]AOH87310.1 AcrR family transcriptional regulator [Sphingomonas panacis]